MISLLQCQAILPVAGRATESLFPKAERLLRKDEIRSLLWDGYDLRSCVGEFESEMDCLVVETFSFWRSACQAFYRDEGPPLRELVSPTEALAYDSFLVRCIELAQILCESTWPVGGKPANNWPELICAVLEAASKHSPSS